jgi:hypothetical protein
VAQRLQVAACLLYRDDVEAREDVRYGAQVGEVALRAVVLPGLPLLRDVPERPDVPRRDDEVVVHPLRGHRLIQRVPEHPQLLRHAGGRSTEYRSRTARARGGGHGGATLLVTRVRVAAQNDPRVRKFLQESDAYLSKLEAEGRNR